MRTHRPPSTARGTLLPPTRRGCLALATLALASFVSGVFAQAPSPSPLDTIAPAPVDTTLPFISTVVATGARCAVVSDVAGVLVIGHTTGLEGKDTVLSVYRLDAQGNPPPATPPVAAAGDKPAQPVVPNKHETVPIKRPDSLAKFPNYVGAMIAHPKLPLLYVWQDIQAPDNPKPEENPVFKDFDHLIIFSIKDGTLVPLVQSTCRGPDFGYGLAAHSLAFDATATRLYIPNIRKPTSPTARAAGIGILQLDANGMPAKLGNLPHITLHDVADVCNYPTGMGFIHGSDESFVLGGPSGPVTVDIANRRARYNPYYFGASSAYTFRITGHPNNQYIFINAIGASFLYMMDHSDGYISGLPRRLTIAGVSTQSPPVPLTKRNLVAFGGAQKIYIASYNAKGVFDSKVDQMPVISPAVNAICYSSRFDRVYAAVDSLPEVKP